MTDQERLLAHIAKEMKEIEVDQDGLINNMLEPEFLEASFEEGQVKFGFTVQPWAVNKSGTVHGGILATSCDCVMALFARFYAGGNFAPTVSIDMKYIRPLRTGDGFTVTAKKVQAGKRMTQMTCEIRSKETDKVIATGAGVFINA